MLGHTVSVGATLDSVVTGATADVVLAAHYCAEAALRLIKAGNKNDQVIFGNAIGIAALNQGRHFSQLFWAVLIYILPELLVVLCNPT